MQNSTENIDWNRTFSNIIHFSEAREITFPIADIEAIQAEMRRSKALIEVQAHKISQLENETNRLRSELLAVALTPVNPTELKQFKAYA